jgi:hypothetical protein
MRATPAIVSITAVLIFVSFGLAADIGDRVTVTLKSGTSYTGTVSAETETEITIVSEADNLKITIPKKLIAEIRLLDKPVKKQETIAPPETKQQIYSASLYGAFFRLHDAESTWGIGWYVLRKLPKVSIGFGYASASRDESNYYHGVFASGTSDQRILLGMIGSARAGKSDVFGLVGLYSAQGWVEGFAEIDPDCSWMGCYRRWLELRLGYSMSGLALGVLTETKVHQSFTIISGGWFVLAPRSFAAGSISACHQVAGCKREEITNNTSPTEILSGGMIGISYRW